MYILDTDHLSVLDRGGVNAQHLIQRLANAGSAQVAASIISRRYTLVYHTSVLLRFIASYC